MHQNTVAVRLFSKAVILALVGFVIFSEFTFAEQNVYLFSYFSDTPNSDGNDGLHLAYSFDGLSYHALNSNIAITGPMVGTTTRDPYLYYGSDGVFRFVHTTLPWNVNTQIAYGQSTDLLNWTNQKYLDVAGTIAGAQQAWAPEITYDPGSSKYVIYWSTSTSTNSNKAIYYCTTTDFSTLSSASVLYNYNGNTTIDADIVYDGTKYVMFAKDERNGYKNIYSTTSTSLTGPYSTTTNPVSLVSDQDQEGPSAIKIGNNWIVYTDHFSNGVYGALISTDNMATWTDITSSVSFPTHTRHGNVLTVPTSVIDSLIQHEPNGTAEIEFDGNAGSSEYSAGGNWVGGSTPGASQTAIIQNGHTVNLTSTPSNSPATLQVGQTSSGALNVSGNATLNVNGDLKIGDNHGGQGELNQTNGTINASNLFVGGLNNVNAVGSFNISGGALNANGNIQISNGAVHLDGGTISTASVYGNGSAAFHFNGGTLKARNSTTSFMTGLNTVDVESGGAVIDTNTYDITVPQALTTASVGGGLTKIGAGVLTLGAANTYSGSTTISEGTVKLGTSPISIAHRWNFNGSLNDSAGGSNAKIVDVGANNVSLASTPGQATLTGGTSTTSDYINLGSNLLPKTNSPITIELWATQNTKQNWSRIFDLGSSTSENLFMSWTRGTTLTQDRVEWMDGTAIGVNDTNQPYSLGTEYHIVLELNPVGSSTVVTWYTSASGNANLGSAKGSFTSPNTLANFVDAADNLGRSFYTSDNTANASYNEVRFWNGALSANTLEILHDAGPDADIYTLNLGVAGSLPSATAVNITGNGATLDLNSINQTVGSLSGVAGSSVLLGSGTLTIGGNDSTTFSGAISGSGGITKNGSGILTLTGNPTYTGNTIINTGALQFSTGTTILAAISGQGELIVGSVTMPTQLTSSSISVGTLTIAANSTVTISPIPGGPLGDTSPPVPVPEPGVWLLLIIATAALCIGSRVKRDLRNK
jgi:autotransporter-associated beta strand protein